MSEKTVRCTDCASEFTDEELEGAEGCPTCGTSSVPCAIAQDINLKINWHELRILTIWASNFAEEKLQGQPGLRTLKSIIGRLHAQFPEKSPLTMEGEFKQLAKLGNLEVLSSDGTVKKYPHNKPD